MSDIYHSVTVVFKENLREELTQRIVDAIELLDGVLSVTPNVSDIMEHVAQRRAEHEIKQKVYKTLWG